MSSQNMKSGLPLREFKKITISHGNYLFTLLICVHSHRPIKCFFELSAMYFNIFMWIDIMLYSWISMDLKNDIFKQNYRQFDYLVRIFKMAVGFHSNIMLANWMKCILVIYCMWVHVYGEYICHHCKFRLGVSEYASKSQKWPDHTVTGISKRPDCYELNKRFNLRGNLRDREVACSVSEPGLECQILCLEGSATSFISPSSGGSSVPV